MARCRTLNVLDQARNLAAGAIRLGLAPVRLVTDRLKMRFAGPLSDLPPGEGAVVDIDGEKVAAFRDEAGVVHAVSPICTHLRCVVAFDPEQGDWHCPCHGSRFGIDGEVVKGPARKPLRKVATKGF